jgi:hypothetical protein
VLHHLAAVQLRKTRGDLFELPIFGLYKRAIASVARKDFDRRE